MLPFSFEEYSANRLRELTNAIECERRRDEAKPRRRRRTYGARGPEWQREKLTAQRERRRQYLIRCERWDLLKAEFGE